RRHRTASAGCRRGGPSRPRLAPAELGVVQRLAWQPAAAYTQTTAARRRQRRRSEGFSYKESVTPRSPPPAWGPDWRRRITACAAPGKRQVTIWRRGHG